jgi:probable HAF family extracellular repeat protein
VVGLAVPLSAQPRYVVSDLGTLGGTFILAQGINRSGQVVGTAYTAGNSAAHAFRTAANSPINPSTDDLGTLGGTNSSATAINSSGQVVGGANTAGNVAGHAFLFSGGAMYDLNTLIPAGTDRLRPIMFDNGHKELRPPCQRKCDIV